MKLFRTLDELAPAASEGTCMAIGVFDGVHRGHQMLIARAVAEAQSRGVRSLVLTFSDHPLRLLAPPYAPPALSSADEKSLLIAQQGVELCAMLDFTPEFAATPALQFLDQIVAHTCRAQYIVCGEDFRYGTRGEGDIALLRRESERLGFVVDVAPSLIDSGLPIKSSRVRLCISSGAIAEGNRLLGRPYRLGGRVVKGDQRGRTIGFPTANIEAPAGRLVPASGVYAVRTDALGAPRHGMLNIGTRPTFSGAARSIEAHLFDFEGDLYGAMLEVDFIARMRDERKFESIAALTKQLHEDEAACRAMLG